MKLITWNVRGLNKLYKQKEMNEFLTVNKVSIIAIIEHRVTEQASKKIVDRIAPLWKWSNNYNTGKRGRIWILWNPNIVSFQLETVHTQYIYMEGSAG